MNSWHIIPYVGVDELRFGDSREMTRAKLEQPVTTFIKSRGELLTDECRELGLHLYYDAGDSLEFIEMFEPADPEFEGLHFLPGELDVVMRGMVERGYQPTEIDSSSHNFEDVGIALYALYKKVEGVAVYVRGYYDNIVEG